VVLRKIPAINRLRGVIRKKSVMAVWKEYIQRRKQCRIIALFGTIDYDPAYDYKCERGDRSPFV
jgi:hypothetical protein